MRHAEDFPGLAGDNPAGKHVAYMDGAACSPVPAPVLDVLVDYYRSMNGEVGHGYHELGFYATDAAIRSRQVLARFVHADPAEIVFTHGATEALNLVAHGWAASHLAPGDEIALPISEHHSNILPWQEVAHATGARLVFMDPNMDGGGFSEEELECKIGAKTKIVACSHISHVLGDEYPLRRIADRAHEVGAVTVFDCAQSLAHRQVDLVEMGADFAAFSGRKSYAPAGAGFLYARRELLVQMRPLLYGDGIEQEVGEWVTSYKEGRELLEAGVRNPGEMVAFAAALRYMEDIGYDEVGKHESSLMERFLWGIADNERVKVYGNRESGEGRCGIVSFNYTGIVPASLAKFLNARGVAVGAGEHGAHLLMGYLGTTGVCRASFGLQTTEEDVDALVDALGSVQSDFAKKFVKV